MTHQRHMGNSDMVHPRSKKIAAVWEKNKFLNTFKYSRIGSMQIQDSSFNEDKETMAGKC